jgi:anti-anti-sigma factor
MTVATDLFVVELQGETLIVTPTCDLHELDFRAIEANGTAVLQRLQSGTARNVVVDLQQTTCCGSTALGEFVQLWRVVKARRGRMALCNVSDQEREALEVTNLDTMWPICSSREEALIAVNRMPVKAAS